MKDLHQGTKRKKGHREPKVVFFCNWGFLGFTTNSIIDFLKVLLIFFPGCSDRASLAKNFMGSRPAASLCYQIVLVNYLPRNGTCFHEMSLRNTFHKGKVLPVLKIIVWLAQKKGIVFVRGAGAGGRWAEGEKSLSLSPPSPPSFQSPRVPPAENSKMAAIGASEINKEESTEKNVSKIVQG